MNRPGTQPARGHATTALALASVVVFLVAWLHFWSAVNRGTGRGWVMHNPWRFWGPHLLSAAALIAVAWAFRRRPEYAPWVSAARWGAFAAVPAWLVALVPAYMVWGIARSIWGIGAGPEGWFALQYGGKSMGLGEFVAMTCVVAGPIALAFVLLAARLLHRGALDPTSVSGVSTSAAALSLAAFAAFVIPTLDAKERARTSNPTTARRLGAAEREGTNLALWNAARWGKHNDLRALLAGDVSPDTANSFGQTPLILAAIGCQNLAARILLENGASVSLKDKQGKDAMAHALASRETECGAMVVALSRAGAIPERGALCVRIVEAAATMATPFVSALADCAVTHGMRDVVAAAHQAAVGSGQKRTATRLATQYGPLPPPASCAVAVPSAAP